MIEIQSPNAYTLQPNKPTIFLGGSIENGKAIDWQKEINEFLSSYDLITFNPRRKQWDASAPQIKSNPVFSEQVNWEINHLNLADLIVMFLDPNTHSPISMLEIGLFANSKKLVVCCPDGFWRKGNIEIVCDNYNVPFFHHIEDLKKYLTAWIGQFNQSINS